MKKEEWYNSPEFMKLRLLGNVASEVHMKCQHLYDLLNIILADKPDLMVFDKFNILERQLRVLQLEAGRFVRECNDFSWKMSPHKWDDWDDYGPIPPGGRKNEGSGPDNQQGQGGEQGGSPQADTARGSEA